MLPVNLSLNNFFSHKESSIDFSNFDSCLLIGNTEGDYSKSNGSGKSAIFESILWCLFNKSRASMMDDIIRWGEIECSVEFSFYHDKILYRVLRTRNRISSTSNVELYKQNKSGKWINISGSTSGETNKKIESVIKLDNKTFVNSVYFRQNDISEFSESEPSRKKEILKGIVDISRWDEYEKSAKKMSKDLLNECNILKSKLEDYDESVVALSEVSEKLESEGKSIEVLAERKKKLSKRLDVAYQRYADKKNSLDTDSYDNLVLDISSLKNDGASLQSKHKSLVLDIDDLVKKISEINSDIKNNKDSIEGIEIVDDAESMLEDASDILVNEKAKLSSNTLMLNSGAKPDVSGDSCSTCGQELTKDIINDINSSREKRIKEYKTLMTMSKNKIKKLEEDVLIHKEAIKNNSKISSAHIKITSMQEVLNTYKSSLEDKKESLDEADVCMKDIIERLNHNKKMLESLKDDDFKKMGDLVMSIKEEIAQTSSLLNDKNRTIGTLNQKVSTLTTKVEEMSSYRDELRNRQKNISVFEKLSKMLGKGGIQTILLDSVIDDLELTSNKILASICNEPSSIVLETQRLGADGSSVIETLDLKVRKDGYLQNFKSLSGGEKFRISLALRIALSDISSRYGGSSLEFLLLDEVNSPLDRYGVETLFVSVIKSLEQKYKMLVITHDESLKEKFDNVINITKINGDSEVEFTTR